MYTPASSASYALKNAENGVYLFVVRGSITMHEHTLGLRDAIGIHGLPNLTYTTGTEGVEMLAIEVPMR
jgi:hypothetical protein